MIEWTIGGRVHVKSNARKVTLLSVVPLLGGLCLEFPWDLGLGLGFESPLAPRTYFHFDMGGN